MEETQEVKVSVEDRAKMMGWRPKEEFKGDESNWRPAEDYVKRADEMMPIMKSQIGKYEQKLNVYESEIKNLKSAVETQKETAQKMVKMSQKAQEMAYKQAMSDLKSKQAQAVGDGDVEKWQALEDKKEELAKPEPIPEPEVQQENPVFTQWHTGNEWYLKDHNMTLWANAYANDLQASNANMTYDDVLKKVEEGAKNAFPNKFENPNRNQASSVETGSQRSSDIKPTKKSYDNLPADAKVQCDKLVEQEIYTKEKFVKDYFEEEV